MTEPVEGWIRRAGERCQALGFSDMGAFLVSHADQEKDHHVLFVKDTRRLVSRWNTLHDRQLDADRLLTQPLTPGVMNYRALHETTISGEAPYCQLAIEFEIERLSLTYGAAAIPKIVRVLGVEVIQGLQFLEEHVKQDRWHTALNEAHLNQLLRDMPSALSVLVETGGLALKAYGQYLSDCLDLASQAVALGKTGKRPPRQSVDVPVNNVEQGAGEHALKHDLED